VGLGLESWCTRVVGGEFGGRDDEGVGGGEDVDEDGEGIGAVAEAGRDILPRGVAVDGFDMDVGRDDGDDLDAAQAGGEVHHSAMEGGEAWMRDRVGIVGVVVVLRTRLLQGS